MTKQQLEAEIREIGIARYSARVRAGFYDDPLARQVLEEFLDDQDSIGTKWPMRIMCFIITISAIGVIIGLFAL